MSPRPTQAQIEATRPDRSNWVEANAGSGKTHVLTERVARLLLAGTEPGRILCLTYTKAAASEMQARLFAMLGGWAMLGDADLAERLAGLAGGDGPAPDGARLAEARRLFARALETPGGLKIQTIHAFCESLLRRFPLEAGISPRFEVADDRAAGALAGRARAEMAEAAEAGRDAAFDRVAARLAEEGIEALGQAVFSDRPAFSVPDPEARIAAHFPEVAAKGDVEIARAAMAELDGPDIDSLLRVLAARGGKREQTLVEFLSAWLATRAEALETATLVTAQLLTKDDRPPERGLATKDVVAARPGAAEEIARLCDWALRTRQAIRGARMAARTADLYAFAGPLLARYGAAKEGAALLDFDDLIARAEALLTRADLRAWVLYKLDQGIDHILVDEAQDTSPQQWRVIAAIAEEFLAGEGARAEARSLFVVGDEKQSIYSFQGAEPRALGAMRAHFAERLQNLGAPLGQPALVTSFRSAPAILDYVDAVFAGAAAEGLTIAGRPPGHVAHRAGDRGRVDLWPLVAREEAPDPPPWYEPVDALPASDARLRLAARVADEIARMIGQARLPARGGRPGRLVRAEDILVLVGKRYPLAPAIIAGLKARGVPVAGADRLALAREIAAKDLLALAKVALMPEDDLSLAALLRSPLCGLSEEALFALAHSREGTLWQALAADPAHGEVAAFLADMAGQADFLRPYEFLERALVRHDGRRRLMARLGAEAEDPIDELLAQALAQERREVPTLAGFVAWVEAGGIEVRREMDRGEGHVRVMTVHGAKGLEAPVVIVPDTTSTGAGGAGRPKLFPVEAHGNKPALTIWAGTKDEDDPVARAAREADEARQRAERKRLLYVALTRAEDWLILCGAEPGRNAAGTWYEMLEAGMDRAGATERLESPTGAGEMLRLERGPGAEGAPAAEPAPAPAAAEAVPAWLGPAPREARVERRSPSELAAHGVQGGAGAGRALALARGTAIHALLERLGDAPPEAWERLAPRVLESEAPDLPEDARAGAIAEAQAARALPEAAPYFGPESLAEVAVAIDDGPGRPRMVGRIDRLLVGPESVAILDLKSDADVPESPESVPEAYLAQLGAYGAAVAAAWPGRHIELAILWTAGPRLMRVPLSSAEHAFDTGIAGS